MRESTLYGRRVHFQPKWAPEKQTQTAKKKPEKMRVNDSACHMPSDAPRTHRSGPLGRGGVMGHDPESAGRGAWAGVTSSSSGTTTTRGTCPVVQCPRPRPPGGGGFGVNGGVGQVLFGPSARGALDPPPPPDPSGRGVGVAPGIDPGSAAAAGGGQARATPRRGVRAARPQARGATGTPPTSAIPGESLPAAGGEREGGVSLAETRLRPLP